MFAAEARARAYRCASPKRRSRSTTRNVEPHARGQNTERIAGREDAVETKAVGEVSGARFSGSRPIGVFRPGSRGENVVFAPYLRIVQRTSPPPALPEAEVSEDEQHYDNDPDDVEDVHTYLPSVSKVDPGSIGTSIVVRYRVQFDCRPGDGSPKESIGPL